MIPLRDANPTAIRPIVNWLLVVISLIVFFALQPRSEPEAAEFAYEHAAIPCEITSGDPLSITEIRTNQCERADERSVFPEKSVVASILYSIFLHGNLGHILGNMWMLWIFGNNIEEAFGHTGYLAFYLAGGALATLGYVATNLSSTIPLVGASGAIAACMGAYLVLFPRARVQAIIPFLFFIPFNVPASIFLMVWFLGQFALVGDGGNIAWQAHVAGFLFGVAAALVLRKSAFARIQHSRVINRSRR